jgi:hypothetical protein
MGRTLVRLPWVRLVCVVDTTQRGLKVEFGEKDRLLECLCLFQLVDMGNFKAPDLMHLNDSLLR